MSVVLSVHLFTQKLRLLPVKRCDVIKTYWSVAEGQISPDEIVTMRYETKEEAEKDAIASLAIGRVGYAHVKYVKILHHDLSSDDPHYHPSQNVVGYAWVIVYPPTKEKR